MQLFGMTDIGQKRETNQDVFCTKQMTEHSGFVIVCDGMGGSAGGLASKMACGILAEYFINHNISMVRGDAAKQMIITALSEANVSVYKTSNLEPGCKGMGTTAVVAVILGNTAHIAHIGDSRAYVLKNDKIYQVTKDHSVVQELFDQGKISRDEVQNHPNKNMITRAIGVNILVDIDYLEIPFEANSKLLLCTDGLSNMVPDSSIEKILKKHEPQIVCQKLIELANKGGGYDNITVAVVE